MDRKAGIHTKKKNLPFLFSPAFFFPPQHGPFRAGTPEKSREKIKKRTPE